MRRNSPATSRFARFLIAAAVAMSGPAPAGEVASRDGARIVYDVQGAGPALVFVHGWTCRRDYWSGQVRDLAVDHRVVTIDLAGHGESGRGSRTDWAMEAFGADVVAVVEQLGLDRVVLVGHSMGGPVILEAARKLKGRVAGLVLVDTYKQLDKPRTPEQVAAAVAPFRENFREQTKARVRTMFTPAMNRETVEMVANQMSSASPDMALPAMHATISYEAQAAATLRELNVPVHAINAGSPPTDVASLQRNGVKVVMIPDTGHFPMLEKPEAFNRALREAVADLSRLKRE
ncbi:alpha/beta fold hydrolase [Usitatibacter palustris]|uniref:AB hydrolase superfamily protein YdjP n=1 Tax=Usitatibacter palustris TaxID=2732487 RepID=A0A6M4HBI0_9PROT|nr:alpha/beta hydrolase [Usitatibacter palustris]QJR16208.1 AB hydrolase superfamily protein YdjP [Usitatibacter palustris]